MVKRRNLQALDGCLEGQMPGWDAQYSPLQKTNRRPMASVLICLAAPPGCRRPTTAHIKRLVKDGLVVRLLPHEHNVSICLQLLLDLQ
jgi:hypothetical protein